MCHGRWEDWHCFLVCSREEGDDGVSALAGPAVSLSGWRVGSQNESVGFLRACRASAPAHGHSRHGDPASCVLCTRNGRRYGYTSHTRAGRDHISPTTLGISLRPSDAVQHRCWGGLQGTGSNKKIPTRRVPCQRTFLCLHSSHLGMGFSSAIFLFFDSESGEVAAGGGSPSRFSSAEGVVGENRRTDMRTLGGKECIICGQQQ